MGREAPDGPGVVGAVNREEVEVEADAIVAEGIVGTGRHDPLRILHLDVDRVRHDPRRLLVLGLHVERLDRALRVFGAEADRPGHDRLARAGRRVEREHVEAELGDVDDEALIVLRPGQDATGRDHELHAGLRLPLVDARIGVAELAEAETPGARDVEEVLPRGHAIAAVLPDHARRLAVTRDVRGERVDLDDRVGRRRQVADRGVDGGGRRARGVLDDDLLLGRRDAARDDRQGGCATDKTSERAKYDGRAHGRTGQQLRCHVFATGARELPAGWPAETRTLRDNLAGCHAMGPSNGLRATNTFAT